MRHWTRLLVLAITLSFVLPYVSWAFEAHTYYSDAAIRFNNRPLEIPDQYGKLVDTFQGEGPLVIHIQDLHCHYEVQQNIARILDYLAEHFQLNLVAIEGASRPVNVTKLSSFPVQEVKQEVGDHFLRQGKISGAEYYAAVGRHPVRLTGIENPEHYQEGRRRVMAFLNNESQGYVWDLREILQTLKGKLYPAELKAFDRKKTAFRQGRMTLFQYCRHLARSLRQAGLSADAFPLLERYAAGRTGDFDRSLDVDRLYAEMDKADALLREGLYTHADQRSLDQLLHRLDIMEKMLSISVSNEEFAEYRAQPYFFQIDTFNAFLQRHSGQGRLELDPEIYKLERYLKQVEAFYANADVRSQDFVQNLLIQMNQEKARLAVLITGGYHTRHLLDMLRMRNISFVSVKPILSRADIVNPYFSLLQKKRTPLEKLLAQNQNIFALEPFFAQFENARAILAERGLPAELQLGYRMLEMTLKLDCIRHLQRQGVAGLDDIRARFEQEIARYQADARNIRVNFDEAMAIDRVFMLPLHEDFFAVMRPRNVQSACPESEIPSLPIGDFELHFYHQGEWSAVASALQGATKRQAWYGDAVRVQLLQALLPAGVLMVNGAALLLPRTGHSWLPQPGSLKGFRESLSRFFKPVLRSGATAWQQVRRPRQLAGRWWQRFASWWQALRLPRVAQMVPAGDAGGLTGAMMTMDMLDQTGKTGGSAVRPAQAGLAARPGQVLRESLGLTKRGQYEGARINKTFQGPQGLQVERIELQDPAPLAGKPLFQGLDFLRQELGDTHQFDLLYDKDGNLLAVFPAAKPEDRAVLEYMDFTPFYYEQPVMGAAEAADKWRAIARANMEKKLQVAWYLTSEINPDAEGAEALNAERSPYVYLELNPGNNAWTAHDFDPMDAEHLRKISSPSTANRLIVPVFPTVFSPATQDKDQYYYQVLAEKLQPQKGGEVLVVGPGSGADSWVAALKGFSEIHAVGINPLEIANLRATAALAGFAVETTQADNIMTADGRYVFQGKTFDYIVWNMPVLRPAREAIYTSRTGHGFWDGDFGGFALKRFAQGLLALLKENGLGIIWNQPLVDFQKAPGKDEVQEILQQASDPSQPNRVLAPLFMGQNVYQVRLAAGRPAIGGLMPWLRAIFVRLGMKGETYDRWVAWVAENIISLALGGLVAVAAMVALGLDVSQTVNLGYLLAWPIFYGLHYVAGKGERASTSNKMLAGIISIINLSLLLTPASLPLLIGLSFISHLLINNLAPLVAGWLGLDRRIVAARDAGGHETAPDELRKGIDAYTAGRSEEDEVFEVPTLGLKYTRSGVNELRSLFKPGQTLLLSVRGVSEGGRRQGKSTLVRALRLGALDVGIDPGDMVFLYGNTMYDAWEVLYEIVKKGQQINWENLRLRFRGLQIQLSLEEIKNLLALYRADEEILLSHDYFLQYYLKHALPRLLAGKKEQIVVLVNDSHHNIMGNEYDIPFLRAEATVIKTELLGET
ncbi:hypothetical protein JW933_11235, partial [candidate division FCPU426 bacterium]|nr:hypothetical protein [candidate division FCPU426 bacterium]